LLAAGVMISGIGILVTGVLIGSTDRVEPEGEAITPMSTMSTSVAHVTVVRDNGTTMVTGLVLDDAGNVLVPSDAVEGSGEIWARCADQESELVEVIGADPATNMAVVRLGRPEGSPVRTSSSPLSVGTEVVTVHAREGSGLSMRDGLVDSVGPAAAGVVDPAGGPTTTALFWAQVNDIPQQGPRGASSDLSGGLVFDRGGRFLGMTTTTLGPPDESTPDVGARMSMVEVMPADAALQVAGRIIASGRG